MKETWYLLSGTSSVMKQEALPAQSQVLCPSVVQRGEELCTKGPLTWDVQCWKEWCGGPQRTCVPQLHCLRAPVTMGSAVSLSGFQLVLKEPFSSWSLWQGGTLYSMITSSLTLLPSVSITGSLSEKKRTNVLLL